MENRGAVRQLVERRLGHRLEAAHGRQLDRVLQKAAAASGHADEHDYTAALLAHPDDSALLGALMTELCIGETYFLREPEVFTAVTETLLPELLARTDGRAFRAWSAGCATGEEIYSLAIGLARSPFRNLRFDLMASDISPDFLRRAKAGLYKSWSFRSPPAWLLPEFFQPEGKGAHRFQRECCAPVEFFRLNLAEDSYPSLASRTESLDLILCRNVLIYFSTEQFAATISRLARCLRPGGWLVVSAVEVPQINDPRLQSRRLGSLTVFERVVAGAPRRTPPHGLVPPPPVPRTDLPLVRPRLVASRPMASPRRRESAWELAHQAVAAGNFPLALEQAERAAMGRRLDPAVHQLVAVLNQELGDWGAAEAALRRVIFLDARHVAAHVALGHVLTRRSRRAEARRHFQNALALVEVLPPDQFLPELDLNAGALARMLRTLLATGESETENPEAMQR